MLDLFHVENNGVVFRPEALAIAEFNALWMRDTTKEKKLAFLEMSFVFYLEDLRSPFKMYSELEKEGRVRNAVFKGVEWEPDQLVRDAQLKYQELTRTRSMKMLQDTWINMDKLGAFLRSVEYTSPKDASSMKGVIEKMPVMIASLKKLEDEVRKELEESGSLKGGRDKGLFEDPQ